MFTMLEQETISGSSETGLSLGETARLLKTYWSPDIGGFIVANGAGPVELMGADDVYYRFRHCGKDPSDAEYNLHLRETIIKIATPDDLI